jgi:hypothetical protein
VVCVQSAWNCWVVVASCPWSEFGPARSALAALPAAIRRRRRTRGEWIAGRGRQGGECRIWNAGSGTGIKMPGGLCACPPTQQVAWDGSLYAELAELRARGRDSPELAMVELAFSAGKPAPEPRGGYCLTDEYAEPSERVHGREGRRRRRGDGIVAQVARQVVQAAPAGRGGGGP